MPWWIIARREIAENWLSGRLPAASLALLLLVLASLVLLAHDFEQRRAGYERRDVSGQTRAGKRPKLAPPPSNLSVLARGVDGRSGRLLIITWSQPRRQPGATVLDTGDENPLLELFGAPDWARIAHYLLSLLALFLTYDALCAERRRGTLHLVFATPLPRSAFLAGKGLGAALSLLLCALPAFLLAAAWLALDGRLGLGEAEWLGAGGIALASLLYAGVFVQVGLAISARAARPATALLVSLGVWTAWAVALPNLATPLSRWARPFPPVEQIEAEKSRLRQGDFDSYLDYANACWAIDDRYIARVDEQTFLARDLSRLSPAGSYAHAVTALARTGVDDMRRFRDAVVRWDREQRRVGYHWEQEIPFAYRLRGAPESWAAALPDLGLLCLWNGLFFAAALALFVRRDLL